MVSTFGKRRDASYDAASLVLEIISFHEVTDNDSVAGIKDSGTLSLITNEPFLSNTVATDFLAASPKVKK